MMKRLTVLTIAAVATWACQNAGPVAPSGAAPGGASATSLGKGVMISATGGGHYDLGVIVKFSMSANQKDDGTASGEFHHKTELNGLVIDFSGRVTCLSVDSANGRAWIGGVVTQNRSEDPRFTTAIHQVGRDIWFRVLDNGEGGGAAPDRTTFVGFEGGGGILTTAEYCAARIWPNDPPNDRTSPLTAGNIQVRP
jgi:hypothetical protein